MNWIMYKIGYSASFQMTMMVMKKEQETMKREALITDDTGISSGFAAQFFNIFSSPPRFQHFPSFLL